VFSRAYLCVTNTGGSAVSREFKFNSDYFKEVAESSSSGSHLKSVWVCVSREVSNDVTFLSALNNSLTVDLSGTRRHLTVMDGKTTETQTNFGDICQVPRGAFARFAWDTLDDYQQSVMLEFSDTIFEIHCPEIISHRFLSGHLLPRNFAPNDGLSSLVRILGRELSAQSGRGRLFSDSVIRLLAFEIAATGWSRKPNLLNMQGSTDLRVRKVIDYIEANFPHDISLQDLTREAGLSATHLISLFKRMTARTPYSYVIHRRIQQAVHLLRKNHMPISEIALEVGFSDQQQMTHAFQTHLKRTPKSFKLGCES
jgi:AraC-like DNA-binding protein